MPARERNSWMGAIAWHFPHVNSGCLLGLRRGEHRIDHGWASANAAPELLEEMGA